MDWAPVVTTILGAAIGVMATLIGDRLRSNREDRKQWQDLKRQSYVEFLVAMNHTQQALCSVALNDEVISARRGVVSRDAFRGNGIYAACEQVMIIAPHPVQIVANHTFELLREFRDRVADLRDGVDGYTPEGKEMLKAYRKSRDDLRLLMHNDLRSGRETTSVRSVQGVAPDFADDHPRWVIPSSS